MSHEILTPLMVTQRRAELDAAADQLYHHIDRTERAICALVPQSADERHQRAQALAGRAYDLSAYIKRWAEQAADLCQAAPHLEEIDPTTANNLLLSAYNQLDSLRKIAARLRMELGEALNDLSLETQRAYFTCVYSGIQQPEEK